MRKKISLAFFVLALLGVSSAKELHSSEDLLKFPRRVVAVGDIHGDLDSLERILLETKIMELMTEEEFLKRQPVLEMVSDAPKSGPPKIFDCLLPIVNILMGADSEEGMPEWRILQEKRVERYRWIGGDTVLIQTGDLLDRGADTIAIFALLKQLQKQAEETGGAVITLIGNHEMMNVCGDLNYVVPDEFATFGLLGDTESEKKMNRKKAFSETGFLGKQIRSWDSVVVVGDTVYSHAGLSYGYSRRDMTILNQSIREAMIGDMKACYNPISVLQHADGPLWNRHYKNPKEQCPMLEEAVKDLKVERMVIGHNAQEDGNIIIACNDRLVLIDVAMSTGMMDNHPAALEVQYTYEGEGDDRKVKDRKTDAVYAEKMRRW